MEEKQVHIKAKIAETLQLCESDLDSEEEATIAAVTEQKAKDLDQLMKLVKEKMIISKRADKLQLLTLVPSTWKVENICQYFSVTHYMVKQSRQLLQSQGILSKPNPRKGRPASQETIDMVTEYYCDDNYSRLVPGKEDFVSIRKNVHEQKSYYKSYYVTFQNYIQTLKKSTQK